MTNNTLYSYSNYSYIQRQIWFKSIYILLKSWD